MLSPGTDTSHVGTTSPLQVQVLGPLGAQRDGTPLDLPGRRERRVLAVLALHPGERVSVARLVELLWADDPPRTAAKTLQAIVSRIRAALGGDDDLVPWQEDGYVLQVSADAVDATRFRILAAEGHDLLRADDPRAATDRLRAALRLWRADEPADLGDTTAALAERTALTEARLQALENRIEADLALGRHAGLVGELEALVDAHPYREPFLRLLAVALYRAGRQPDALRAIDRAGRRFADDLGTDPSPALVHLRARIDAHDPSLRAPPRAPRSNLPAEVSSFVGRGDELAEVDATLQQARLVTLTGPGGVGKSRLAMRAAQATLSRHPGGTWLVDLATIDAPDTVAHATASALGVEDPTAIGVAAALGPKRALLLLDTCEHVLDGVRPLVRHLLRACPDVRVLATSREPLGLDGEHLVEVPTLDPPGAARLFGERARAVDPGFTLSPRTRPLVEDICRRLDGLPLAIELAAARIRALPLEGLANRLDQRMQLLTSQRSGRHRGLAAAIDWSYELLTETQRAVLRHTAVFAGAFAPDTAARVCDLSDVPGEDVLAHLLRLVDRSMLTATSAGRYRMLDTVRAFGAERLVEAGERDRVQQAHAVALTELAEHVGQQMLGPDEAQAVQRLEAELDDLRAAHAWASAAGHVDLALRLPFALRWFAFSTTRTEVYDWATVAARVGEGSGHPLLAEVIGMTALGASYQADADQTLARAARADEAARATGQAGSVLALLARSRTALHRGHLDDAVRLGHELVELDERVGDGVSAQMWRVGQLLARSYAGERQDVVPEITALLDAARDDPYPSIRAWTLYGHGEVLSESDPEQALQSLREAIRLARSVGDRMVLGIASVTVASIAGRFGDPSEGFRTIEEVLALWHDRGAWTHLWTAVRNLVELLGRTDRLAAAVTLERATAASSTAPPVYGEQEARLHDVIEQARSDLPADEFDEARRRGAAMTDEDAVAFAGTAITGALDVAS